MTGQPAASPLAPSDTPSRPSLGPLLFAVAVTVIWCGILTAMAWRTANPIALNRDQILRADLVITGKVEGNPHAGEVSVIREWKKNGLKGSIHVENLDDTPARAGETYVMPLAPAATGYRVAPAHMDSVAVLIYPATPAALAQLEEILAVRDEKK